MVIASLLALYAAPQVLDRHLLRPYWLLPRRQWVTVITGLIFVICVLAFRRGIVGELGAWWASRRG